MKVFSIYIFNYKNITSLQFYFMFSNFYVQNREEKKVRTKKTKTENIFVNKQALLSVLPDCILIFDKR